MVRDENGAALGNSAPEDIFVAGSVVSVDPIVTVSKCTERLPSGIAGLCPDVFEDQPALHLLSPTWTLERDGDVAQIAYAVADIAKKLPRSRFVVVTSTEFEAYLLSCEGIPSMLASTLIFVDERTLIPKQPASGQKIFDAVYNARFEPFKRHELAQDIESLVFVYDHLAPNDTAYFEEMRALFPNAMFHNHAAGRGEYRKLSIEDVCDVSAHAQVGLCLSSEEGAMRASMEYALCGLPIVSTRSTGGRDRYFVGPHVYVAEEDPASVAAGVSHLIGQNLNKMQVRNHVAHMLAFDRHNFILSLNKLVKSLLGTDDCFESFGPFVGDPITWKRLSEALGPLAGRVADG